MPARRLWQNHCSSSTAPAIFVTLHKHCTKLKLNFRVTHPLQIIKPWLLAMQSHSPHISEGSHAAYTHRVKTKLLYGATCADEIQLTNNVIMDGNHAFVKAHDQRSDKCKWAQPVQSLSLPHVQPDDYDNVGWASSFWLHTSAVIFILHRTFATLSTLN